MQRHVSCASPQKLPGPSNPQPSHLFALEFQLAFLSVFTWKRIPRPKEITKNGFVEHRFRGSRSKEACTLDHSSFEGRIRGSTSSVSHHAPRGTLQEVHSDSLAAILEYPWIKKNFAVSNVDAPERYFTLIMVSQHLQAESWLRFPLPTSMGRDALLVDLPISPIGGDSEHSKRILRLCTTHLESLWEPSKTKQNGLFQLSLNNGISSSEDISCPKAFL